MCVSALIEVVTPSSVDPLLITNASLPLRDRYKTIVRAPSDVLDFRPQNFVGSFLT